MSVTFFLRVKHGVMLETAGAALGFSACMGLKLNGLQGAWPMVHTLNLQHDNELDVSSALLWCHLAIANRSTITSMQQL